MIIPILLLQGPDGNPGSRGLPGYGGVMVG